MLCFKEKLPLAIIKNQRVFSYSINHKIESTARLNISSQKRAYITGSPKYPVFQVPVVKASMFLSVFPFP